jgi:hypothetical protein
MKHRDKKGIKNLPEMPKARDDLGDQNLRMIFK